MIYQDSEEIIHFHIDDVGVRQFYDCTAQDLLYFLIVFNGLICIVGFGAGQFIGENLILLGFYPLALLAFFALMFFEFSLVNNFIRAHHTTMKKQKHNMRKNKKKIFVSYNYLEPKKYWLVIAVSFFVFLSITLIGIYQTQQVGLKNF